MSCLFCASGPAPARRSCDERQSTEQKSICGRGIGVSALWRLYVAWLLVPLTFSTAICARAAPDLTHMRQEIESLIKHSGAEAVSVSFHDLETARELLIRPDEKYHPASTMKIAGMMEAFRQANEGGFQLNDTHPVINAFASTADGSR